MKKLLALIAALVIGGAAFAQNKTKGLDFHFGVPHNRNLFFKSESLGDRKITQSWYELGFQFKLATYDGLWLNDAIGVYAGAGVGIAATWFSYVESASGGDKAREALLETSPLAVYGEFMLGPSFGVNIGKIRFQSGVAFHALVEGANGKTEKNGAETKEKLSTVSLGFVLAPQFRFFADKRISLVAGTDLIFDFPLYAERTIETDTGSQTLLLEFDSNLRFAFTPYIGLGINF